MIEAIKLTLRAARINKGLSTEEAAKELNISRHTLYKYEEGSSSPNVKTALAMSKLYGVSIDMLDFPIGNSSEKPN